LFEQLNQAATEKGRTLSQEAEMRLEYASRDERLLDEILALCYRPEIAGLVKLIATVAAEVGPPAALDSAVAQGREVTIQTVQGWLKDAFAYNQVCQAITFALECYRPDGERVPARLNKPNIRGELDLNAVKRNRGTGTMLGWIEAVADPEGSGATLKQQQEAAKIARQLGADIAGRWSANLERLRGEKAEEESDAVS
jgi:hypothetical protein